MWSYSFLKEEEGQEKALERGKREGNEEKEAIYKVIDALQKRCQKSGVGGSTSTLELKFHAFDIF